MRFPRNTPPLLPHQFSIRAFLTLGVILALTLLFWCNPDRPLSLMPCLFHKMTGLPCALCGGTRAACSLLHGNFHRAFTLNPLAFPAIAFLFGMGSVSLLEILLGRPLADWHLAWFRALKFLPWLAGILILWWFAHMTIAIRQSNTDLVNLKKAPAAWIYRKTHGNHLIEK